MRSMVVISRPINPCLPKQVNSIPPPVDSRVGLWLTLAQDISLTAGSVSEAPLASLPVQRASADRATASCRGHD